MTMAPPDGGEVHVKASLRACKVPVGHRQLSVRAVLKLSIPRQRRPSSTMRWRQEENGAHEEDGGGDDADVAITSLTSEIESRTSRAELLKKDIAEHEAQAEKLLESISGAEAQRDKEGKANQASIVDLTKNLQMLKGAIVVLKKHQATEFPQIKVSLLQAPNAMDKLDAFMDSHDSATSPRRTPRA